MPHWQFQKSRLICGALIDTRVIAFQSSNTLLVVITVMSIRVKVQILWEGHNIWKNLPLYIFDITYLVTSKKLWDFFRILRPSQNIWTLNFTDTKVITSNDLAQCLKTNYSFIKSFAERVLEKEHLCTLESQNHRRGCQRCHGFQGLSWEFETEGATY